jgi:hypothetical protein
MPELAILFIGDIDWPEFCNVQTGLESLGRLSCARDPRRATAMLRTGEIVPDVIIIGQAFPQQFSQLDVDHLLHLAPLCRIVGLLGSWCEGETRSGRPLAGAVRLYWHQWNSRAQRELRQLVEGKCPSWGLPATATDEERLLAGAAEPPPQGQGLVAIQARCPEMGDWLSAACRQCGYSTVLLRRGQLAGIEGAAAAIFEGSDLTGDELEQLRDLVASLAGAPVIVLLDFPRIEDYHRAIDAGAAAVLSKPLNLDDLFWQLSQLAVA